MTCQGKKTLKNTWKTNKQTKPEDCITHAKRLCSSDSQKWQYMYPFLCLWHFVGTINYSTERLATWYKRKEGKLDLQVPLLWSTWYMCEWICPLPAQQIKFGSSLNFSNLRCRWRKSQGPEIIIIRTFEN